MIVDVLESNYQTLNQIERKLEGLQTGYNLRGTQSVATAWQLFLLSLTPSLGLPTQFATPEWYSCLFVTNAENVTQNCSSTS